MQVKLPTGFDKVNEVLIKGLPQGQLSLMTSAYVTPRTNLSLEFLMHAQKLGHSNVGFICLEQ